MKKKAELLTQSELKILKNNTLTEFTQTLKIGERNLVE